MSMSVALSPYITNECADLARLLARSLASAYYQLNRVGWNEIISLRSNDRFRIDRSTTNLSKLSDFSTFSPANEREKKKKKKKKETRCCENLGDKSFVVYKKKLEVNCATVLNCKSAYLLGTAIVLLASCCLFKVVHGYSRKWKFYVVYFLGKCTFVRYRDDSKLRLLPWRE